MRSTHSSRLKRFPSRSMRSSYRTSMLVKDGPISSRYLYNIEEDRYGPRRSRESLPVGDPRFKGPAEILRDPAIESERTIPRVGGSGRLAWTDNTASALLAGERWG